MADFEKLGLFYLGRESNASGAQLGQTVLYDSRDLLTHAVCVGMTGSGKTGLCVSIVEEAAIDGVPVIAIDPKGDLANLLLTFPRLAPEDFRPWIDEDEARRAGVTPEAFAQQQADLWRKGLADWGEDGARIERLRASAEFNIYTPGSRAGRPLSVLSSFAAPPQAIRDDAEALAERASSTATGVLTLAGANAEPRGREHTFLSSLLSAAWREGRDLDLGSLIQQVQSPPFQKIGVLDLDSFYPAKERFDLAMQLNAVLASPGFEQWLEGEPLDAGTLLYNATGGPRVSILSIAHLNDAQRMFFVSLLLNQVVGWMRGQSGTTSLRAIVYMDEIAGYFPPVANPPSKPPLLTLLKQARAFGVGVMLATQNTVDLDYKGLANAGTWFLGRLQTERDKARVLQGLEGVSTGSIDRTELDKTLSSLGKRVFLLHNVHEKAPHTFQTRWTLSYLRGPLSRDQIRRLTADRDATAEAGSRSSEVRDPRSEVGGPKPEARSPKPGSGPRPVLEPGIQQFFLPFSEAPSHYVPVALGVARVAFNDAKLEIDESRDIVAITRIADGAVPVDWTAAEILAVAPADLETAPAEGTAFDPVPRPAAAPKNYAAWQKSFAAWLAQGQRIDLQRHAGLKITSRAGESERDFRIRVQDAQRQARDTEVEDVRRKYAEKRARLEERVRRAEQGVAREQEQVSQARLQTAVSFGATVLGAFLGRKAVSASTLGRATTAARGLGRSAKEQDDVKRAQETVDVARKELEQLDAQIEEDTKAIAARFEADAGRFETVSLAPKRGQISVQFVALGWKPE
jgi:DNA helicase HerA-like ATPase